MLKKHINLFFLLIIVLVSTHITAFNSITLAQEYASTHPEYPQTDNDNLLNPDYTTFYRKYLPTWIDSVAQFFKIESKPLWTINEFKNTLTTLTDFRSSNSYHGRFVEKIQPPVESSIILFGDIHGSFHSLTRDLKELMRLGFINDNFKIIKENTYIVFNGDVIDLSGYILETLTLVANIMLANPDTVIYLRGRHEDKEYWQNFGLRKELEIRARGLSKEQIPFLSLINKFFDSLPLALYIVAPNEKALSVLRISPEGRKGAGLNEEDFDDFFAQKGQKPDIFNVINKNSSKTKVDVKAIIKSDEHTSSYVVTKGLVATEPDQGATAWLTLSAPNLTNRSLYEFFYDAFSIITIKELMADWTIALYNRDVRDIQGFIKSSEYNILNGQEITQKKEEPKSLAVQNAELKKELTTIKTEEQELRSQLESCKTGDNEKITAEKSPKKETEFVEKKVETTNTSISDSGEILVGTSLDLSKHLSVESKASLTGLHLAIDRINKIGGIKGSKIRLIVLDDEFDPEKARKNVESLLNQYNCSIILKPMGSAPIQGYLNLIKEKKVLVLFPNTGSAALHDAALPYVINFQPSYDDINVALMKFAQEKLGAKKFAIFYAEDISSTNINEHVKQAGIGQTDHIMVPYTPETLNFESQAAAINKFDPDALILLGTARITEKLIQAIKVENLIKKYLLGTDLTDEALIKFLTDNGLINQFYDTQYVPNPKTSDIEIMREYRQELDNKSKIDVYSAESYVCASIFIDMLNHIEGQITHEAIIKQLQSIHNYNFKGLTLNFNEPTREISPYVWLSRQHGEWIELKAVSQEPEKKNSLETNIEVKKNDEHDIVIGTLQDFSKQLRVESELTLVGLNLAFDHANKHGGIHGRKLRLIALDDEYDPKIARKNVDLLFSNYNSSIILVPMGSTPIQGYLDLIKEKKLLVLFPSTGSETLRDPTMTNLIHFRPSYPDITTALIRYAKNNLHAQRFAFFYPEDATVPSLQHQIQQANIAQGDYIMVPYAPKTLTFQPQADAINTFKPDVIVLLGTARAAEKLLTAIKVENLVKKYVLGTELSDAAFSNYVKEHGLGSRFIDTQNIPNPKTSRTQIMQHYRKDIGSEAKIDPFSAESYIAASIFIDALRKIDGPITNEAIVAQLESIKDYNFEGLELNFYQQTRELSPYIWLVTQNPEWIPVKALPTTPENPHIKEKKSELKTNDEKKTDSQSTSQKESETTKKDIDQEQNELVVGTTLDLSKTLKAESEYTKLGLHKAFDKINREGGVKGKRIKLVVLDDEYDPKKARANVEKMIKNDNVQFIVSPMGATPVHGFLDLVKEKKIVCAFPSTGDPTLRNPTIPYMIHFRPSYNAIDTAMLVYAQQKLNAHKFAYFYATDESATDIENSITRSGIKKENSINVSYTPNTTDFNKQAKDIKKFKPNAIALFGTSRGATELIRQIGVQNLVGVSLLGVELGDELFKSFIKEEGLTHQVVDSQNLPNPHTSNLEIVVEFRKEMGNTPLDIFILEAYISGTLFAEIIKRIDGDITKENFITTAEAMKDVTFKGLKLNFNPTSRELSEQIWLDTGEKDWISINIDELLKSVKT